MMDDPRIDEMENRKDERHEPEKCELCKGRGFEVMAGVVLGECGDCEGIGYKLEAQDGN